MLVDDALSPAVARNAALILGVVAFALDVSILLAGTTTAAVMLFTALFLSWGYSAPPLRLHARGLGPPTAAIAVGALTPLIGAAMQRLPITLDAVLAVLPFAFAQFTLILVLDLPDARGDAIAGKRTIAVRIGAIGAARLAIALVVATYVVTLGVAWVGIPRSTAIAMTATAPIAALLVRELRRRRWDSTPDAERLTFRAVAWFGALPTASLVGGLFGLA